MEKKSDVDGEHHGLNHFVDYGSVRVLVRLGRSTRVRVHDVLPNHAENAVELTYEKPFCPRAIRREVY